jgi:tetratricopeptide (TPR) repeat protein
MRHPLFLCLLSCLAVASAHVRASGTYEALPLQPDEAFLIEFSEEINRHFERGSMLVGNDAALSFVREIGNALAPGATDDYIRYRFFILRDPSPNAFALPNGDVYIHVGMLARLWKPAQLAAVLAHEIAHVAGHHAIIEYRDDRRNRVFDAIGQGINGRAGWPIEFGRDASMYGYDEELEYEADDSAIDVLSRTGYAPEALADLLQILESDQESVDARMQTVWTQPETLRVREARIGGQTKNVPLQSSPDLEGILMPFRFLTVHDYIREDRPRNALGLAQSLMQLAPLQPALSQLVGDAFQALGPTEMVDVRKLKWEERRRIDHRRALKTVPERNAAQAVTVEGRAALARHLAEAEHSYRAAIELDAQFAPAYRGLGEVLQATESPRDAASAYVQYLRLAPDATDRSVILARLAKLNGVLNALEVGK